MVKLVFCLTRLPHLSREEFQRYWRERHGPLVRESAKALGIRRYVQVHTLDTPVNEALRRGRLRANGRSCGRAYDPASARARSRR